VWFAVHPVHAESVANIVGRSELVCAAGLLVVALVATRRIGPGALEHSGAAPRRGLRSDWWTVAIASAVAVGSKEIGVVAPFIAWAAAERGKRGWKLAGAAAAGVAVLLAARLIVLGSLAGHAPAYAFTLLHGMDAERLALSYIPTAVALVLVPQPPALDYSPSDAVIRHPSLPATVLGTLLVVAAIWALVCHVRRPTRWTLAACWSAATFAPVSNLFLRSGIVVADRTLYSPSIGVALMVGAGVAAAWSARRWALVVGVALLTAVGSWIAADSIPSWHDSRAAFEAIRVRSPHSFIAHYMAAKVRDIDGDPTGAAAQYDTALALAPDHGSVLYMAGANALRLRDTARALTLLSRSVAVEPMHYRARTALARLTLDRGDTATALALLRDGLALDSTQRGWRAEVERLGRAGR
jgi:hypothetical protein